MHASRFKPPLVGALLGALCTCLCAASAIGPALADLSNHEAASAIRGALDQGAASAVAKLGVPGGFLDKPKGKIPLSPAEHPIAQGPAGGFRAPDGATARDALD